MMSSLIALAALSQLPSQSGPTHLPFGNQVHYVQEGKRSRTYLLEVPKAVASGKPLPLVVALHGWTANGAAMEVYSGLGPVALKEGFLLACPDGTSKPLGWNSYILQLGEKGVDDVKFIKDVISDVERLTKVDHRRVYLCGHSNGAMMTYYAATSLGKELAAIGVVSGSVGFDKSNNPIRMPEPKYPVSAIILHGKKDMMVPYDHTKGSFAPGMISAPDSASFWAKACGITNSPKVTVSSDLKTEIKTWQGPNNLTVELVSFAKGTHDFPGGFSYNRRETAAGASGANILWDFFKAHPKR